MADRYEKTKVNQYNICIMDENDNVLHDEMMFETISDLTTFIKVCLDNDIPISLCRYPKELR